VRSQWSTFSHHLDTLTRSGLCTKQRSRSFIYYAVNWRETSNLVRFLTEDCCAKMHAEWAQSRQKLAATARTVAALIMNRRLAFVLNPTN